VETQQPAGLPSDEYVRKFRPSTMASGYIKRAPAPPARRPRAHAAPCRALTRARARARRAQGAAGDIHPPAQRPGDQAHDRDVGAAARLHASQGRLQLAAVHPEQAGLRALAQLRVSRQHARHGAVAAACWLAGRARPPNSGLPLCREAASLGAARAAASLSTGAAQAWAWDKVAQMVKVLDETPAEQAEWILFLQPDTVIDDVAFTFPFEFYQARGPAP